MSKSLWDLLLCLCLLLPVLCLCSSSNELEDEFKANFQKVVDSISHNHEILSSTCWQTYVSLLKNKPSLLFRMFDASGRPFGVLGGNLQALGNFPECKSLEADAHFCVVFLPIFGNTQNKTNSAAKELKLGLCLPSKCGAEDFWMLSPILGLLDITSGFRANMNASTGVCMAEQNGYSSGSVMGIVVLSLLGAVVILCTALHYYHPDGRLFSSSASSPSEVNQSLMNEKQEVRHTPSKAFLTVRAFSAIYNLPRLLDSSSRGQMTSLNGLRVISLLWVILCHTCLWAQEHLVDVSDASQKYSALILQIITNGFSSVDTFFFLSGFLVAFLSIKELKRKGRIPWHMFYFHRIWRLTPVYMFVVFITATMYPLLVSGPNSVHQGLDQGQLCQKYWWSNLLYINNFYPPTEAGACVRVAWYLANDTQMFIVSPLFFFAFYKSRIVGWVLVGLGLAQSILTSSLIAASKGYMANQNLQTTGDFFGDIYDKPYIRIDSYLIGMSVAFIYIQLVERQQRIKKKNDSHPMIIDDHHDTEAPHTIQLESKGTDKDNGKDEGIGMEIDNKEKPKPVESHSQESQVHIPLPSYVSYPLMLFGGFLMCLIVFGTYSSSNGEVWSKAEDVLYIAFNRIVWSTGLGCIVIMCLTGNGGWVNSILSIPIFNVMTKMTFSAYLIHPLLLHILFNHYAGQIFSDGFLILLLFLGMTAISFGCALVTSLLVEMPVVNLEKVIFSSPSDH